MAHNIREEIRRLHRRKQLHYNHQSDSSDMEGPASPSSPSCSNVYTPSTKEKPLFTFRQVCKIIIWNDDVFCILLFMDKYNSRLD